MKSDTIFLTKADKSGTILIINVSDQLRVPSTMTESLRSFKPMQNDTYLQSEIK